jgi:PLP dependent protein
MSCKMTSISENIARLKEQIPQGVKLIAVSKTKSVQQIMEAYNSGQSLFGENYVQELIEKQPQLPGDIEWHFIGHLQSNKVKYIAPFVYCIHGVDSFKLLKEISKQAMKNNRVIRCLLQVHIAREESKFGFSTDELRAEIKMYNATEYAGIELIGLMGMASFTGNEEDIREEFKALHQQFIELKQSTLSTSPVFTELSMGMSSDWPIAAAEGSTMIRVGSAIFGSRN